MSVPRRYVLIAVFWACVAMVLAWPSLNVPFSGDDLHLVRAYSPAELQSIWTGPWDTDGIETAGYRPLTTVFNHLRASLFGENVTLHRLFLLALFVLFLTLAMDVARRTLSASFGISALAGVLTLTHITSTFHYLWISDGVHLAGGGLMLAAIGLWIRALHTGKARWLIGAAAGVILSLLVREDSLMVLPLLGWFAILCRWNRSMSLRRKWVVIFAAGLTASVGLFWVLRGQWVPDAVNVRFDLTDYAWLVGQIVQNLGDRTNLIASWPVYEGLIGLWLVCLGGLLAMWLFGVPMANRRAAAGWGVAMLIAALPGLTLPRTNLILMAVTFWCLCVATILRGFARRSRLAALVSASVAVGVIAGSIWGSTTLQLESQPANLDWICGQPEWVYGQNATATIPAVRRAAVKAWLVRFGIHNMAEVGTRYPQLVAEAIAANRIGPNAKGEPFIPQLAFIVSPGWEEWSCIVQSGWRLPAPR